MTYRSAHFLPGANKKLGDKYLLLECLGDGTHGWVWRAERLADQEIVAVKIPKQLSAPERSLAEGKELLGVKPHENVIQFFDMGKVPPEKEWYAIEMEYFPSESLAQKLEHRSTHFGNTYERLFNIYAQVLEAVDYLSTLEPPISHGDIKPHNILVGLGDLIKLTDFGSSALPEEIYVRTRENGGTVLYSAPEFCDCASRKGSYEALLAADIYSLGVLLYQLMTGRLPHDTQAEVRSYMPFPKPREVNSGICPELETVIMTCLAKEPQDRFSSVSDLKRAFGRASKLQLGYSSKVELAEARNDAHIDWSTDVVSALDKGDYYKASRLAATEYRRSSDSNALLMQTNALYRDERWSDLEKLLESLPEEVLYREDQNGPVIRIIVLKAMLKWRNFDLVQRVLNFALEHDPESFEVALVDASLDGMRARYQDARDKLEKLNRAFPMTGAVLKRLVQVCEQLRDYDASSGYLRAALRVLREDDQLQRKRKQYEMLGVW